MYFFCHQLRPSINLNGALNLFDKDEGRELRLGFFFIHGLRLDLLAISIFSFITGEAFSPSEKKLADFCRFVKLEQYLLTINKDTKLFRL